MIGNFLRRIEIMAVSVLALSALATFAAAAPPRNLQQ